MKVQFLGTGAGRGWPIAWCSCGSCLSLRKEGVVRATTSILIDDTLMVDCGAEAAIAAVKAGVSLTSVRHVLVTHVHEDHWSPRILKAREYVKLSDPIHLVGPDAVTRDAAKIPHQALSITTARAMDEVRLGPYSVTALSANHYGEAVGPALIYDIADQRGRRVLYATDTGPLPEDTVAAVSDRRFDLVLMDEAYGDKMEPSGAHQTIATFGSTLERLRAVNAVVDTTKVFAIHLGHGNPPTAELRKRLESIGAGVPFDGDEILL